MIEISPEIKAALLAEFPELASVFVRLKNEK